MAEASEFEFTREPGGAKPVKICVTEDKVEQVVVPLGLTNQTCALAAVQHVQFGELRVLATVSRTFTLFDASGPAFILHQTVWQSPFEMSDNVHSFHRACAAILRRLAAGKPDMPAQLGWILGFHRWLGLGIGAAAALWAAYLLSSRVSSAGFWNHDLPVLMTSLIEGSINVEDQRLLLLSFLLLIGLPYLYAFGPATRRTTVTALLKKLEGRTGDL
jgi:hypothetical protein